MILLNLLFWSAFISLMYTYIAYPFIAFLGAKQKRKRNENEAQLPTDWPAVTLLIAAYNEARYMSEKMANIFELDYPKDKLNVVFVTDGSTDGTPALLKKYPTVKVLHQTRRAGKIAAVDRAMKYVDTPFTVFTDANTFLNKAAIKNLVKHFSDPLVGAVAGEKRVQKADGASAEGESLYWKYESTLKQLDSDWGSVVGAAGELFAIRTSLFESLPQDTLLDDFMQTLLITKKGYQVKYEPQAFALETASLNIKEEQKRKVRIAAGGIQSIIRLGDLANPLKYGMQSIRYLSHRVFRWTLAPVALCMLWLSNLLLLSTGAPFFVVAFILQTLFYLLACLGAIFAGKKGPFPGFFVPFYFSLMHWNALLGIGRFLKGAQSVQWEKARRARAMLTMD